MIPMLIYDQYSIHINFVYAAIKIINLTNSKRCIIFAVGNRDNNLKKQYYYVEREITCSN